MLASWPVASTWTPDAVRRVAELARLELDAAEVELFTRQLTDILAYAELVRDVDTTGIPPTVHPLGSGATGRDDRPSGSLDRREVLRAAPDARAESGLFRVPKVL
jgi:aspartyl-tRNA(Asn)/glutamyl-tRNA(Gln) amidotransferase subunit C